MGKVCTFYYLQQLVLVEMFISEWNFVQKSMCKGGALVLIILVFRHAGVSFLWFLRIFLVFSARER